MSTRTLPKKMNNGKRKIYNAKAMPLAFVDLCKRTPQDGGRGECRQHDGYSGSVTLAYPLWMALGRQGTQYSCT